MSKALDLLMDSSNHPVERRAGQQLQIRVNTPFPFLWFILIDYSRLTQGIPS